MDGVGSPTDNANNKIYGTYSDEPSLIDFATPPPSQYVDNGVDLQQQQQPEPPQQGTPNLLDFGAPTPQLQTQEAATLVDLFGGPKILPSSPNPDFTPNTTPQPQSQAQQQQPLDLFGSPIPSATATPTVPKTSSTPIGDAFSPVASFTPLMAGADDPFAVFLQPQTQPQVAAFPDPFSAGKLSLPAQPEPKATTTIAVETEAKKPVKPVLPEQPDPMSSTMEATTEATPLTESETPQRTTAIAKSNAKEKKDQDSPMVPTVLTTQEDSVVDVGVASGNAESAGNFDCKKEADASLLECDAGNTTLEEGNTSGQMESIKPKNIEINNKIPDEPVTAKEEKKNEGSIPNPLPIPNGDKIGSIETITDKESAQPLVSSPSTSPTAPETPKQDLFSSVQSSDGDAASEEKSEHHELNLVENPPEEASSTNSTTIVPVSEPVTTNGDGGAIPVGSKADSRTQEGNKDQKQEVDTKQTAADSESSMTDVAATHGDTKQQQQQQHLQQASPSNFLSTLTKSPKVPERKAPVAGNRFSGFKSMAGSIAAKGAERVAKVKDQIQKDEANGQATNANRFTGFKSIAGSMAAKGAERVAKVKDQIQKDDADGKNVNAKRFAGFKTMAGSMAAKGAERVAKVKDQIQKEDADGQHVTAKRFSGLKNMAGTKLASVQVPQRFNAAKLPLFGIGNSSHGSKPAFAIQASPPPPSSAAAYDSSLQTPTVTVAVKNTKSPSNPTTSISAPMAAATDTPHLAEGSTPPNEAYSPKQSASTDLQTSKAAEISGETGTDNNKKNSLPLQAKHVPSISKENIPTEKDENANCVAESSNSTKSEAQKSPEVDTPASDGTKSPERVMSKSTEESTAVPMQVSSRAHKPATSSAKDSSVESKPEEIEGTVSSSEKMEAKSVKPDDNSKATLAPSSTSPKGNPIVKNASGALNEPQSQQTTSKTQQSSLPTQQTSNIEVLQKELHAAHTLIMQLQHHENVEEERPGDAVMVELQANLQKEMTRRAEAEEKARLAIAKSKQINEEYTTFKTVSKSNLDEMITNVESLTSKKDAMEKELVEIREERDEQGRQEMALTTRLNAAKKKEAVKANAAEHYEDLVDQLELAVKDYGSQVESLTAERDQLKVELGEWKEYAEKRTSQLEMALNDEKKVNDERKRKMKGFVEAKTEEVRAAKADFISLQTELDHNSHSLTELNQRYKQLHAQWVQSQTRNRELQRDAMKMKKDSEKMHKVGGSLEARLSRSAQQSEDHKNKRLHARNELMSVLAQLEAERSVNIQLQESIKMTFTPKALSQQHTIQEALDDFEGALQKLSTRIGRPVPPSFSNDPNAFTDDNQSEDGGTLGLDTTNVGDAVDTLGTVTLSEINGNKAVQKLENETQRVSQKIVKFSASIERMHSILDGGGTRNCVDVLSQILMSGNAPAIAAKPTRKSSGGGQRYGQISRNVP